MLSKFEKSEKFRLHKDVSEKKMPSEHEEGVCAITAEKIKRCNCMFEGVNRFWSETEKRFNDISSAF